MYGKNIKRWYTKEMCYDKQEKRGNAICGRCFGEMGGDKTTDYLASECCDCKFLVLIDKPNILRK